MTMIQYLFSKYIKSFLSLVRYILIFLKGERFTDFFLNSYVSVNIFVAFLDERQFGENKNLASHTFAFKHSKMSYLLSFYMDEL